MDDMNDVDKLRFILMRTREEAGLTQKEMAELIEKTENTVYNWENGVCTPKFIDVQKWFEVLGMPIDLEDFVTSSYENMQNENLESWIDEIMQRDFLSQPAPMPKNMAIFTSKEAHDYYSGERDYCNFPHNIAEELF